MLSRSLDVFFSFRCFFLISVKLLTTEKTENKTTSNICKITVSRAEPNFYSGPLEAMRNRHVDSASIVRRLSVCLTCFSCSSGMDRKKALIFLFSKRKMKCLCTFGCAHLQHFQSPRSYRAHALSSVAKSSLPQLDMQRCLVYFSPC